MRDVSALIWKVAEATGAAPSREGRFRYSYVDHLAISARKHPWEVEYYDRIVPSPYLVVYQIHRGLSASPGYRVLQLKMFGRSLVLIMAVMDYEDDDDTEG